jgi:hypothetical protein
MGVEISSKLVFDYLGMEGAVLSGIGTPETLKGCPPSTDLIDIITNSNVQERRSK